MEEGVIQLNKIFQWNPETDTIDNVSVSSKTLSQIAALSGKSITELHKEIEKRELVLKHMVKHDIRSVEEVKNVLDLYFKNGDNVLERIILNR